MMSKKIEKISDGSDTSGRHGGLWSQNPPLSSTNYGLDQDSAAGASTAGASVVRVTAEGVRGRGRAASGSRKRSSSRSRSGSGRGTGSSWAGGEESEWSEGSLGAVAPKLPRKGKDKGKEKDGDEEEEYRDLRETEKEFVEEGMPDSGRPEEVLEFIRDRLGYIRGLMLEVKERAERSKRMSGPEKESIRKMEKGLEDTVQDINDAARWGIEALVTRKVRMVRKWKEEEKNARRLEGEIGRMREEIKEDREEILKLRIGKVDKELVGSGSKDRIEREDELRKELEKARKELEEERERNASVTDRVTEMVVAQLEAALGERGPTAEMADRATSPFPEIPPDRRDRATSPMRGAAPGYRRAPAAGASPVGTGPIGGPAAPAAPLLGNQEWVAVGRGGRKGRKRGPKGVEGAEAGPGRPVAQRALPAPPATAAVSVRLEPGGLSFAEALRKARADVAPGAGGVRPAFVRRSANGGLLFGLAGPGREGEADALATQLRASLPGAVVTRPSRMGEVRLVGFDESVLPNEVVEVLAVRGGCGPGEVRLGPIRWGWRGEGAVWARLPLAAATKVAAEGRVALGWAGARVVMLAPRPLQCHRCWRLGHIRAVCSASIDRSGLCYRCGRAGHIARACREEASCAVCREDGRASDHRVGGPECPLVGGGPAGGRPAGHRRGRPPNAAAMGQGDPGPVGQAGPIPPREVEMAPV